jgi:FixJ family two-component response regulator
MGSLPLIGIVDDDESMREALPDLVKDLGYAARAFASAEEFLASDAASSVKCLILDIGLPGMTGPELRQHLLSLGLRIPTIFITARAERSLPLGLLGDEHVTCLIKPFNTRALRDALTAVVERK